MTTTLERELLAAADRGTAAQRRAALAAERDPAPERPTPGEKYLIRLLADGHTNQQITARLGISQRALDNRVRRILEATGICCRAHLVINARIRGWIS